MSLTSVFDAWKRLNAASTQWQDMLGRAGLDLPLSSQKDFADALTARVQVYRDIDGFEDFDPAGQTGIEPGDPARSLLYHAFASTNVVQNRGVPLSEFPRPDEIAALENFIYAAADVSFDDLLDRARALSGNRDAQLVVAVFAYEYHPAPRTPHRKHADLCFSRTGVARAGTHPAHYSPSDRGWYTFLPNDAAYTIRVIPARYAAFIAVRLRGNRRTFGPKYFRDPAAGDIGDAAREFLVPIHKLFSGGDCIRGLELNVSFEAEHVNEKLSRVHRELARRGLPATQGSVLYEPPYRFTHRLAAIQASHGTALVTPLQNPLVEAATLDGQYVSFTVPPSPSVFVSSYRIRPDDNKHHPCPKYLHCRTEVMGNGQIVDLTEDPQMMARIRQGGFQALHYVDFTGDGAVKVSCDGLPECLTYPAYSIISQPDFLPYVSQSDLFDWWREQCLDELKDFSWGRDLDSLPVSANRLAANFETHPVFDAFDSTVATIIASPRHHDGAVQQVDAQDDEPSPNSCLPDDVCGDLAPGWDISVDARQSLEHMAAYGLSSPFPEDARLCAAFGANWPAAAPDITNWFAADGYYAVAPLGNQFAGWDRTLLPAPLFENGTLYDFPAAAYSDWVFVARDGLFDLVRMKKVTLKAYTDRILVTSRIYRVLGPKYTKYTIVLFQQMRSADFGLNSAISQSGSKKVKSSNAYGVELFAETARVLGPFDFKRVTIQTGQTISAYGGPDAVIMKDDQGNWVEHS